MTHAISPEPREAGVFKNLENTPGRFKNVMKWISTRKREPWPDWIDSEPCPAPPARIEQGLRVTFVNHSTALIQTEGMNILTDPVFSDRAGHVSFLGTKRVRAPGIRFTDLPTIDIVLLSHNHYDHMDLPTLKKLEKRFSPLFVAGLGNKKFLEKEGMRRVVELDWWERTSIGDKSVHFVPAQHFSGRTPWNIDRSLWGGFMIESSQGGIYFAGDTGFGKFFERIREKFPDIRLALLPIGAYEPRWFMSPIHISPGEAVRVHLLLRPAISIGIHLGTFRLADEGIDTPSVQLDKALMEKGVEPEEFIILDNGGSISMADPSTSPEKPTYYIQRKRTNIIPGDDNENNR